MGDGSTVPYGKSSSEQEARLGTQKDTQPKVVRVGVLGEGLMGPSENQTKTKAPLLRATQAAGTPYGPVLRVSVNVRRQPEGQGKEPPL